MMDPTDAMGTKRHAPKYLAVAAYALSCLVVAVGLSRLGLAGLPLVVALVVAAGVLLWVVFLPLFRRLHRSATDE
ncbi:hypothetical protein [Salinigranum halophilum]|jgi:heme A synthase|uniref:hypothetical protein n=1 Tax=Salinigranum halophilum TaxID=2565931 RepID=UPI00115DA480|nr:hypothetical protein [Salinigranum halophilum]